MEDKEYLKHLLPVKLHKKAVVEKNSFGKTFVVNYLRAANGKLITEERLPEQWTNYIIDAINNYYKTTIKPHKRERIIKSTTIVTLTIPGLPVQISDGRSLKENKDGTFILSNSPEYSNWLRYISTNKRSITKGTGWRLPIEVPVEVDFKFHLPYANGKKYYIPDLTGSVLDVMQRINIISDKSFNIVKSIGKVKICYTKIKREQKTIVTVKEFLE